MSVLRISVVSVGEIIPETVGSDEGVGEVHIVTDDGAVFRISQSGDHTINIRTPNGRLIIEPVAANAIDLKMKGI